MAFLIRMACARIGAEWQAQQPLTIHKSAAVGTSSAIS